jgi:Holliday junction resolvasome RuvABC endonuclease subunit
MILLGADAGFLRPGLVIVDIDESTLDLETSTVLEVMTIETERMDKKSRKLQDVSVAEDDASRIKKIVVGIEDIVTRHRPKLAIVELPISGAKSSVAAKGMAFASATFVSTLYCLKVDTVLISPYDNKIGSTGNVKAEKEEVIAAVVSIWPDISWPLMRSKSRAKEPDNGKLEALSDALSTIITYVKLRKKNAKLVLVKHE